MNLTVTIALAVSLAFTGGSSQINTFQSMPQAQTVEQYVRSYFSDQPLLAEIAGCESHFQQYGKDGQVLKNSEGSSAVGVFQVMSSIHSSFADEQLGLDIDTLQGNVAYARYLYNQEGTKPWNSSKACWSKTQAYKDAQAKDTASAIAINKN